MTEDGVLRTSRELWEALRVRAGLTLSARDAKTTTYDDAFVDELRKDLFGEAREDKREDFEELLVRHATPLERLLTSFFRALAPYPRMAADILRMFEAAAAKRSDENLRIVMDVDGIEGMLKFDLNAFRDVVRRLDRLTRLVRVRHWRPHNARSLERVIEESGLVRPLPEPESPEIRAWVEIMDRRHRFPDLPPAPFTGVAAYDRLVSDLWFDFRDFHSAARELFGSYDQITRAPSEGADYQGWDWRLLRFESHDRWPRHTVHRLAVLGDLIRRDPNNFQVQGCLARLVDAVAAITPPPEPQEVLTEILDDIFSLPVWQKRHEFYAVWIASVITYALRPYQVEFHVHDRTLAFPFRPVRIASIGSANTERLELWSELRSPAVDPLGRVGAVQPDYRIRWSETTGAGTPPPGPDLLIVECKQYKRSSTRNFAEALEDYARAAPRAHVLLANYGPVSPRVSVAVAHDVAERCHPIGQVIPGGEGLLRVVEAISDVGRDALGPAPASDWTLDEIEIELKWGTQGIDLDLYVTTPDGVCGYESPHRLPEVRFHGDDRGKGPGPHMEILTIRPKTSERFDIVVRAYSGVSTVGSAELTVTWRGPDVGLARIMREPVHEPVFCLVCTALAAL